jgi:uncharacterized protein (TIGR01777 family)
MKAEAFERRVVLPVSAARAFAWHESPGALERLTPPWEDVEVVERVGEALRPGSRVRLRTRLGPWSMDWVAEHREYVPGRLFSDVALRGPFARWEHRHEFIDQADGTCVLRDQVEYVLPGGAAGRCLAGRMVRRRLEALFAWRQEVTRGDLQHGADHEGGGTLRVLVSGASGLVGRALLPFLRTQGHEVVRLVRRRARAADEIEWDPESGKVDLRGAEGVDAVVHLAGAGIAEGRWTERRREILRASRVPATRRLAEALAGLSRPPRVVVGGSAIGFYGETGEAWVDEASAGGRGFLAELARDWEEAWEPLRGAGVRQVWLRTGVVLSPAGGALAKVLPAFRMGLGGPVGSGRQWWSWISIEDLIGVIGHALASPGLSGPLNAVAPGVVRNEEFARVLGRVLGRPALVPAPAWALRAALGRGLANEALLASQRVRPGVLEASGYRFRHERLEEALRRLLGRVL